MLNLIQHLSSMNHESTETLKQVQGDISIEEDRLHKVHFSPEPSGTMLILRITRPPGRMTISIYSFYQKLRHLVPKFQERKMLSSEVEESKFGKT